MHLAGDVVAGTGDLRVYVLSDFDDLAAKFVTYYYGSVVGQVSAVVGHHFISETRTTSYMVYGLVGAADRSGHHSYLYFGMSNSGLWRLVGELQPVTGEAGFLQC
jgi:hypothetical protein